MQHPPEKIWLFVWRPAVSALYLSENLRKELLHSLPGALVGLLVVGGSLAVVVAGCSVGETVNGIAVADELPVNAGLSHLILKCGHLVGFYKGIVGAVQGQHPALDVLCILGRGRCQSSVEADYAFHIGSIAGQFQYGGASEAVADGGDAMRINQFLFFQFFKSGPD